MKYPKEKLGVTTRKKKRNGSLCAQILRRKGCKLPSELGKVGLLRTTHKERNRYTGSHAQQQDLETEPRC
jgi:hypothetical protein